MAELKERTLRHVQVLRTPFRNFSGRPTKFNPDGGKRSFNLSLPQDIALEMRDEGWKIRELAPRDDQDVPLYLLEVKVSFKGRPPRIVKVTPTGREELTEDAVDALDAVDIEFADVIVNPYNWGEGVSAYLKTGYFNIAMDELEMLYELDDETSGKMVCDDDGVCYIDGVRVQ